MGEQCMKHMFDASNSVDPHYPLYESRWEHDACGTGFLAHIGGEKSHLIVQSALEALARLTHRGAQDVDAEMYDGAGIMTQIPHDLLRDELEQLHMGHSDDPADLAVGMIFLPSQERSPATYEESRRIIEQTLTEIGLVFLGWRTPPIDYSILGSRARATAPTIAQVLLSRPANLSLDSYVRTLYYARRLIERRLYTAQIADCYIASLSHTTLI
jgi:glutamate synthase domain-containing protein 1